MITALAEKEVTEAALRGGAFALEQLRGIVASQAEHLTEARATLAELAESAEFGDGTGGPVVDQVARVETVVSFLPRQIAAREAACARLEEVLLKSACDFVSRGLAPKASRLLEQARSKMQVLLGAEFQGELLEDAIEQSNLVREARRLSLDLSIETRPMDGTSGYVKRVLKAAESLAVVAAKLA
jgi:hypothetical protein